MLITKLKDENEKIHKDVKASLCEYRCIYFTNIIIAIAMNILIIPLILLLLRLQYSNLVKLLTNDEKYSQDPGILSIFIPGWIFTSMVFISAVTK